MSERDPFKQGCNCFRRGDNLDRQFSQESDKDVLLLLNISGKSSLDE